MVKKVDHDYDTLDFAHGQWSKLVIWPQQFWNFGHGHGQKFDHLTMTLGRRPNGQKIMVILPPPPPNLLLYG